MRERVARLEERAKNMEQNRLRQVKECGKTFDAINKKLHVVNLEQGETRDAIVELQNVVERRVSAPMSGKDRAVIYAALVTGISGIVIALIPLIGAALSG